MELVLMRHGEAEAVATTDSERRLTPVGSQANRRVAKALQARICVFDLALMSPYARARQTADDVEMELGSLNFRQSHLVLPDTSPSEVIESLPSDTALRVLLIGHNPLLSRLAALLIEGNADTGLHLETSELLCLRADILAPGCGSIVFSLHA